MKIRIRRPLEPTIGILAVAAGIVWAWAIVVLLLLLQG